MSTGLGGYDPESGLFALRTKPPSLPNLGGHAPKYGRDSINLSALGAYAPKSRSLTKIFTPKNSFYPPFLGAYLPDCPDSSPDLLTWI